MLRKVILIILSISYLFAVKDILYKPVIFNNTDRYILKYTYTLNSGYPADLSTSTETDDYNFFLYNNHFRVIIGKQQYNSSPFIRNLANFILDVSEFVWQKEIDEFGFRPPRYSDINYIDIYLGNTGAYNPEKKEYVNIENYYAGYATTYSDQTPYFVINPSISEEIIKVTIAHEFFHTIQYAYNFDMVSEDIFYNHNLWFLEATATMMEDEIYDDVDDYIYFLDDYLKNTYLDIEDYNGSIEYGKVLFAKFLRENYGLDFIKKIFEDYDYQNETVIDKIAKEITNEYNLSIDDLMIRYAECLVNIKSCYEEGASYPEPTKFSLDVNLSIGHFGIALFDKGGEYLIGNTPQYFQFNFNKESNLKDNIENSGLLVINKKFSQLKTDLLNLNRYSGLKLYSGWNMVSNIFSENLDLKTFGSCDIVWVYRDGKYYAYSDKEEIQNSIKFYNYDTNENFLYPGEGAWVYCENETLVEFDKDRLINYDLQYKSGWNFVSVYNNAFDLNEIDENILIWHYDGDWKYFSKENFDINYDRFDIVKPMEGYFIYKKQ